VNDALARELDLLPAYLSQHLLLSITALAAGIALSLPLAILVIPRQKSRALVLMVAAAVQTIPSLALLALMVPLLRRIGFLPAVIALIVYSILPILRNVVTGIQGVDAKLIEAGRGLGMTRNQILTKVQIPLAMPVIIAGIRTATVWVVGITTLSTPVGATSLGNYIFSGLQTQNYSAVLVGCVSAAGLALVLDGLIRFVEIAAARRSRNLIGISSLLVVVVLSAGLWPVLISAFRSDDRPQAVIGAKTFTEQYILAALIGDRLTAAGFQSRTLESLGSTVVFDALIAGRVDTYVDYTGTIWANYMHRQDNPGRERIYSEVTTWLRDTYAVDVAARLGFENAYALAMTTERATELRVADIDALTLHASGLKIGGDYEFFARPEWTALQSRYGLQFAEQRSMDPTIMYSAVASGEVDVIAAFSTDGRIAAFDLVVLDDSRAALPPYDAVVLTAPGAELRLPGLRNILAPLDGSIDAALMRSANKHVDLDGGTIRQAAELIERSSSALKSH